MKQYTVRATVRAFAPVTARQNWLGQPYDISVSVFAHDCQDAITKAREAFNLSSQLVVRFLDCRAARFARICEILDNAQSESEASEKLAQYVVNAAIVQYIGHWA